MKTISKIIGTVLLIVFVSCNKESLQPAATENDVSNATEATYHIGEKHAGGIIFYLDSTKKHGLVAAATDQGTQTSWYNGTYISTGAKDTKIGSGASNTTKIINKQGKGTYAAKICRQYRGGGFSDWFLPSKAELNQLYLHKNAVGNFEATNYWSSSESDKNNAYDQVFNGGYKFADDKSFTIHVRAVRSF